MLSFSAFAASILLIASPSFWSHWGDGKAEISTYEVVQNRYGQERDARVAHIYVTEPFNTNKQVKSDRGSGQDIVQVLKQNRVKLYQTGVYEYSVMSSVFVPLNDYSVKITGGDAKIPAQAGDPIKVTFSSQEWCGMTFHQLNNHGQVLESHSYSYFEAESDQRKTLAKSGQTLLADELFIAVRELVRPLQEGEYDYYPSLEFCRLFHVDLRPKKATVNKRSGKVRHEGKDQNVTIWTIKSGDEIWEFSVAQDEVRRILAYHHKDGSTTIEQGTLLKSERMPYWVLQQNKDEALLKQLGLKPTVSSK